MNCKHCNKLDENALPEGNYCSNCGKWTGEPHEARSSVALIGTRSVGSQSAAICVERVATECATEALRNGYEARHLSSQEDAMPGDYEALDEALGRHATVGERIDFRHAFSAQLAQGRA